ncbi:MAG: DNA polymerase III subunit [Planctomycetota bacterium]|jgi:DNA polymerase-3 subunit delta'
MAFENVPSQQETARKLRATLRSGRIPHAYLFVGSTGTGRLAMARELVRIRLCGGSEAPDEYCGACRNCRLLAGDRHPDFREVGVPEGRQSLPIDAIRQVQRTAALRPVVAARRAFVIRQAEHLSLDAANCFLKTLEEPPGGSFFVLIASSLRLLPETIVSRCRTVRFPNLAPAALRQRLEAEGADPADARWLARRSWGSPGLAAHFRAQSLHEFNAELVERLRTLTVADNFETSDWLRAMAREEAGSAAESREVLQDLLECAALHYVDLAVAASGGRQGAPLANTGAAEEGGGATPAPDAEPFVRRAEIVLDAIEAIGANAQRRLALDSLFTRLGRLAAKT